MNTADAELRFSGYQFTHSRNALTRATNSCIVLRFSACLQQLIFIVILCYMLHQESSKVHHTADQRIFLAQQQLRIEQTEPFVSFLITR